MILADLRYASRQLRKSPGFTITAIITLALGIGANAVVFSVLNALILRPVNVPDAQSLYQLQRKYNNIQIPSHAYLNYIDLRDRNRTFASLAEYMIIGEVGVDTGGNPSTAWPYLASGNYFDTLEVQPYLGRFYHASDEKGYDSAPYVVLSYAYWSSHFRQDAGVVGRQIDINKHPFTILGVAPPEFHGTELFFAPAMWIPLVEQPTVMSSNNLQYRSANSGWIIGHLRPGVTPAMATSDLNSIGAWLAKTYPAADDGMQLSLARPGLAGDMLGKPARAFMAGMMLLAGLILLAACANLGSLFAARTADRAKEVAVRLALGSRKATILRQLVTEALLVSAAGGALGLAGALFLLRVLSAWNPLRDVPINVPINPDIRTYAVALLLAIVSGLLFGVVPVGQVLRADPWQVIRTGSAGGGVKKFMLRDVLLVVQIAICALLVTSSLVAMRGLMRSLNGNYGFSPQNVMLVNSDLRMSGYSVENAAQMQRRMIDAAAAIPGVTSVGTVDNVPLGISNDDSDVFADSTTDYRPTNAVGDAMNYVISPGYLEASGTKLLAGRDLTLNDNSNAPIVALINRRFAEKVFGSVQKAVGGHFKFWSGNRAEVVGVVEDGKYRTLSEDPMFAMFFSFQQHPGTNTWLVVRSQRDPQEIAQALDHAMHGLDSSLPLSIMSWIQQLDGALFTPHVATVALGVLGFLGAMLAITGVFGMASYVVSKRLRELGIRVALGAGRREILSTALGRALRLLAIGSAAGVVLGVLGARVLASIVYQATPKDPVVLGGVTFTMLLLGLLAAWIPARRALAVDPLILLREE
ncbi:MAG TPA: ABC transporter permease [Terracidiphilus sp.]|nr:ABC transporter permease [Terracidiphilus sp.]